MKKLKTTEFTGKGIVIDNNKEISTVNYHLIKEQKFNPTPISHDDREIKLQPSTKTIYGNIEVLDGEINLIGRRGLILQLDDGRKVKFYVTSSTPPHTSFPIKVSGGFHLPD